MTRNSSLLAIAAAALAGTAALVLLAVSPEPGDRADTSLSALLHTSSSPLRLQLYSNENGADGKSVTAQGRGTERLDASGLAVKRYIWGPDGSYEDIDLKADGESPALRRTYFPEQPGENGWRPHITQTFAPEGNTVVDENVARLDGTLQEHTVASADGGRHVTGYGADGVTVIHDLVVLPREYSWSQPILQKEQRWSDDGKHAMLYDNFINPDDKSHTVTEWDAQARITKVVHTPAGGSVTGTTIRAYYPGTTQVRLDANVSSVADVAKYFRKDGTLDHVLKLSGTSITVRYFDSTGKNMLLEQLWYRRTTIVDHVSNVTTELSQIKEVAPDGTILKEIDYWDGKPSLWEAFNVTVNGVLYSEVDHIYSKAGTLDAVHYWIGKVDHKYDVEEVHTPQEKIFAPAMPAEYTQLRVNLDEDDLPVPPPQGGMH